MVITVASGKGGTGKTTIAVNLAKTISENIPDLFKAVWLLDCDVEEPNAGLFLNPKITEEQRSDRFLPVIDPDKCTGCGRCAEVCEYNAIALAGGKVIFFKELCHACGSCTLNCPEKAISETAQQVGTLRRGYSGDLRFAEGILEIGFSSPVPIIRDLKKWTECGLIPEEIFILKPIFCKLESIASIFSLLSLPFTTASPKTTFRVVISRFLSSSCTAQIHRLQTIFFM